MRLLTALTLLAAALGGCGDGSDPPEARDAEPAARPDARADTPGPVVDSAEADPRARGAEIWFSSGDTLVPVVRPDTAGSVRAALDALLAGPTAAERDRGLSSWFGPETRGLVREVRRDSGRLVVSFERSLQSTIPGAASSAGSEALLAALDSTVFQFPDVEAVEYRLGESCAAFWEWLQRECHVVRR